MPDAKIWHVRPSVAPDSVINIIIAAADAAAPGAESHRLRARRVLNYAVLETAPFSPEAVQSFKSALPLSIFCCFPPPPDHCISDHFSVAKSINALEKANTKNNETPQSYTAPKAAAAASAVLVGVEQNKKSLSRSSLPDKLFSLVWEREENEHCSNQETYFMKAT